MRESQPIFSDVSLSWLLAPTEQAVAPNDSSGNTAITASRSEAAISQTLYNQGASLSKISSTVEELSDTMLDLKQSFRALRLELNTTPSTRGTDSNGGDEAMDMLRTVLKELQLKSNEIEKLKLENASLKLKAKYLHNRETSSLPMTPRALESFVLPEVQSPGFLNESGKGASPSISSHLRVTDTFDGYESPMDHTITTEVIQYDTAPAKVRLKPAAEVLPDPDATITKLQPAGIEPDSRRRRASGEPAAKRPRLELEENSDSSNSNIIVQNNPPPKKRGRPSFRTKSIQSITDGDSALVSTTTRSDVKPDSRSGPDTPVTEETSIEASTTVGSATVAPKLRRGRPRASTFRSMSQQDPRPRSVSRRLTRGDTKINENTSGTALEDRTPENECPSREKGIEIAVNVAELTPESVVNENDLFSRLSNPGQEGEDISSGMNSSDDNQRQAKVVAREVLVRAAMEREEAMADN